jgi:hypothetical protein
MTALNPVSENERVPYARIRRLYHYAVEIEIQKLVDSKTHVLVSASAWWFKYVRDSR